MADGVHVPCNFDGQAGGGAERSRTSLSPKAEGREVPWVQGSGEGELWPPSPSAVTRIFPAPLHTQMMEKTPGSLAPCLAWAPCLLGQLLEAPSSVGLPEPPPGRVTLANAPTHQDCGLSRIQNRPGAQMYSFSGSAAASWNNHGDSLPEFTFEWREEDFFSPGASGTWLSALGTSAGCQSWPLSVCLSPVSRWL